MTKFQEGTQEAGGQWIEQALGATMIRGGAKTAQVSSAALFYSSFFFVMIGSTCKIHSALYSAYSAQV